MRLASDSRLKADTIVTIASRSDQALVVLVRGPITEHRSQMTIGGPGSWFEVHGLDRRDLLDRTCVQAAWTGRLPTSHARSSRQISTRSRSRTPPRSYETNATTLNQRSTDLEFLRQIARAQQSALLDHLRGLAPAARRRARGRRDREPRRLAAAAEERRSRCRSPAPCRSRRRHRLQLRVHVPSKRCPNVTAFQVNTDGAGPAPTGPARCRPRTSIRDDRRQRPAAAAGDGPKRLPDIAASARAVHGRRRRPAGHPDPRRGGALTEAGLFVQATASTTKHLLGGVLKPHDVISAIGVGPKLGKAAFRIKQVTHVINAAEHFMDLSLEIQRAGRLTMDDALLDAVTARHYGKYRGRVVDNIDPTRRGRLQVVVPAVMGQTAGLGDALRALCRRRRRLLRRCRRSAPASGSSSRRQPRPADLEPAASGPTDEIDSADAVPAVKFFKTTDSVSIRIDDDDRRDRDREPAGRESRSRRRRSRRGEHDRPDQAMPTKTVLGQRLRRQQRRLHGDLKAEAAWRVPVQDAALPGCSAMRRRCRRSVMSPEPCGSSATTGHAGHPGRRPPVSGAVPPFTSSATG